MISFIKGELEHIEGSRIIVEHGGIGYEILVPLSVSDQLPQPGNIVKIYTYLHVREDIMQLFGFLTRDELRMFKLVITVNGIGPKGALAIFSVMDADSLRYAILSEDTKSIMKAQGIGAKAAGKLILELKDKCNPEDLLDGAKEKMVPADGHGISATMQDAVQALTALGYSGNEAVQAIREARVTPEMGVEDVLKASLKKL